MNGLNNTLLNSDGFRCGPITLHVSAENTSLLAQVVSELLLYDLKSKETGRDYTVHVRETRAKKPLGDCSFLQCRNMHVEKLDTGLVATCRSGAFGEYNETTRHWDIALPSELLGNVDNLAIDINIEDILELVLTVGWREAGWIPLHAGVVVHDDSSVIITAPSRGGKTTLTAAFLHLGWQTLGDDKLLLGLEEDGSPKLLAVQEHFNIDPKTRNWFPEVGDLSGMQRDSIWTPKRRVTIDSIWPQQLLDETQPTHLIQINRHTNRRPTTLRPLDGLSTLSALLHQTVVPKDTEIARAIIAVIASTARQLKGFSLELGEDAYSDASTFDVLAAITK